MASPANGVEVAVPPRKQRTRTHVACRRCHAQKIKCDGEIPCRNCRRSNCAFACDFPVRDRKVTVSDNYIKSLRAENEELRRKQHEATSPPPPVTAPEDPPTTRNQVSLRETSTEPDADEDVATADAATPLLEQRVFFTGEDSSTTRPVYIGGAACAAFATRLRSYVTGSKTTDSSPCLIRVYKHQRLLRGLDAEYALPHRAYAVMLAQVVLQFVGNDYHLLQKKSFFEKLEQLYDEQVEADPIFLCRVFTVFALGELYLKKASMDERGARMIPGVNFFLQASSLFQELYEEPNVEYIETLLLMSFYCYALNRKNTTYTYSGLALRLSITLGLHRNITYGPNIRAVDIENRRRVWWTVYTFDRLCSSKLGHPVMIKDEDIDAPLPSSSNLSPDEREEFVDADQLVANIRLAQITGSILDLIYGIPSSRDGFVRNVHKILTALKEWDASLNPGLKLNNEKIPSYSERSVASLRLHFNQCIILTTRPVLLYVFKQHVKRTSGELGADTEESTCRQLSPTTIAMGEACIYAARASNRLLGQLWANGNIATYGFFDAHYIFSSMIVLMMSETLNSNIPDKDSIDLGWNLIRSMVDDGNLPAKEFSERLSSLQKDLDDLGRSSNMQTFRPHRGYMSSAGTFAAHVTPSQRPSPMQTSDLGSKKDSVSAAMTSSRPISSPAALLDDPFIRDFLNQPDAEWSPSVLDIGNDGAGSWSLAWDAGNILQAMRDS